MKTLIEEIEKQLKQAPDMCHMWRVWGQEDLDRLIDALGGDSSNTNGSLVSSYHYLLLLMLKKIVREVEND